MCFHKTSIYRLTLYDRTWKLYGIHIQKVCGSCYIHVPTYRYIPSVLCLAFWSQIWTALFPLLMYIFLTWDYKNAYTDTRLLRQAVRIDGLRLRISSRDWRKKKKERDVLGFWKEKGGTKRKVRPLFRKLHWILRKLKLSRRRKCICVLEGWTQRKPFREMQEKNWQIIMRRSAIFFHRSSSASWPTWLGLEPASQVWET